MTNKIREDIFLAAFAVSLGYEIYHAAANFNANGVPQESLHFGRDNGSVHIWETARGWRVAKREKFDDVFPRPEASDFHKTLLEALKHGQTL